MTFFINYLSPGKVWKSIYIGLGVLNIEMEIEAMALAKHVVRREKVKDGALGSIFKRCAEEEQKTYSKGYFLHFKRQSATERSGGRRPEKGPVDSAKKFS